MLKPAWARLLAVVAVPRATKSRTRIIVFNNSLPSKRVVTALHQSNFNFCAFPFQASVIGVFGLRHPVNSVSCSLATLLVLYLAVFRLAQRVVLLIHCSFIIVSGISTFCFHLGEDRSLIVTFMSDLRVDILGYRAAPCYPD
jgi:hypothetical protein